MLALPSKALMKTIALRLTSGLCDTVENFDFKADMRFKRYDTTATTFLTPKKSSETSINYRLVRAPISAFFVIISPFLNSHNKGLISLPRRSHSAGFKRLLIGILRQIIQIWLNSAQFPLN
jgi:hypothetical protein